MTDWTLPSGLVLTNVHDEAVCVGACVIHAPTDHRMSSWELAWRNDRGIFERLCPQHGTGHPDPDQRDYWSRTDQEWQGVHGCCGCCQDWSFVNMELCCMCGNPVEVIAQRGSGFCSQLCARAEEPGHVELVARFKSNSEVE